MTCLNHLEDKMEKIGASDISEWILGAYGNAHAAVDTAHAGASPALSPAHRSPEELPRRWDIKSRQ